MTNPFSGATQFLVGVQEELKSVAWPNRTELVGSLLVVFIGVVLMASFISVCNVVLSSVAHFLLR